MLSELGSPSPTSCYTWAALQYHFFIAKCPGKVWNTGQYFREGGGILTQMGKNWRMYPSSQFRCEFWMFWIFEYFWKFLKISQIFENLKTLEILKNFENFLKFSNFFQILKIFDNSWRFYTKLLKKSFYERIFLIKMQ